MNDVKGQTFGRLTAQADGPRFDNGRSRTMHCECTCGNVKIIRVASLLAGTSRSCGCLRRELTAARNVANATHGMKGTPEYRAWQSLKDRCTNPRSKDYPSYGGRGISVAPEWANDFQAFFDHIGPKPTPAHSVDRIDVNGNYEPGNVRWATAQQQRLNQRRCLPAAA